METNCCETQKESGVHAVLALTDGNELFMRHKWRAVCMLLAVTDGNEMFMRHKWRAMCMLLAVTDRNELMETNRLL